VSSQQPITPDGGLWVRVGCRAGNPFERGATMVNVNSSGAEGKFAARFSDGR
jgi:hypothetical protein